MTQKSSVSLSVLLLLAATIGFAANDKPAEVMLHGYVLDSACAFTKDLRKPISEKCARDCAKAGSPLVVLTDDGEVYWPISEKTPAEGQNARLLPFAGKKVTVTGRIYARGGSKAIAIEKIE
jgi:hypothetical protein